MVWRITWFISCFECIAAGLREMQELDRQNSVWMKKGENTARMKRIFKKIFGVLTSRVVIIGFLILLQLAWFLILFFRLLQYATWINTGLVILSILVELYIVSKPGNPSYKILWLLFIGSVPVLGCLMYFLFGDKRPSRKIRRQLHRGRRAIGSRAASEDVLGQLPQRMAEIGAPNWNAL